jgi:hypothetical protein
MIWATTQHYSHAAHEITTLESGAALDESQFLAARQQAIETITRGVLTSPKRTISDDSGDRT